MAAQLYKVRSVEIPDSVMLLSDGPQISTLTIPAFPFMYWPNGTACDVLNMYFIDVAHLSTGDSLKTAASELSHIVRYCSRHSRPFADLHDADIFDFVKLLKEERATRRKSERARNHNTIRTILGRTIRLLLWYQKTFVLPTATPLIGLKDQSPQIVVSLVESTSPHRRKTHWYYTHRAMPTPESTESKGPIAQPVIEAIEKCVDELSAVEAQRPRFVQRFQSHPEMMQAQLDYVRVRRHFMIWVMKRTGLRPSEMVEISVKQHETVLQTKRFLIPSKKRRRDAAPLRSFPITLKDAAVYLRYATGRKKYCASLERAGIPAAPSDALFLSVDGTPIKKSSLERDFARLVAAAGFQDTQACFSMFRHRFITYEVIVHLKEFMVNSGKPAQMMTETDYQSILKRVSAKIGHGSVQSLWHYIDLAWNEINVWGSIDKAINRLHAADRLHDEILELKREMDTIKASPATKKLVAEFSSKLKSILESAKAELESDEKS